MYFSQGNQEYSSPDFFKLISENKHDKLKIKSWLENAPANIKGKIFEEFISVLYRGNGYLTQVCGGKNDGGADVLVFAPESPVTPIRIIQTKNHVKPISYDDTRTELRKFEEVSSVEHKCNQFEIISINGFVKGVTETSHPLALRRYNLALKSWDNLFNLIDNFDLTDPQSPSLFLNGYNLDTYSKVEELFVSNKRVSVVQATGTGKRFLVGQYLLDRIGKKCLFLSPSHYINEQQRKLLPFLDVTYKTYAGNLADFNADGIVSGSFDCIVVDEFHRLGAREWGNSFNKLLSENPNAEVFGVTATPVRHSEFDRDMRSEIFSDTCANEISLYDAIARKILPSPKYVTGLYNIDSTREEMLKNISSSNESEDNKSILADKLNGICVNWEKTSGVPQILNKHLTDLSGKYMVFCENQEHLDEIIEDVRKWFRKASKLQGQKNVKINDFAVHSGLSKLENDQSLVEFKKPLASGEVRLMFSINMFNEGLHIDDVNSVLLMRKTSSLLIYLQQIGRCLKTDSSKTPIIFDLVNNIDNVSHQTFTKLITDAVSYENKKRRIDGLIDNQVEIVIKDEITDIKEALNQLSHRLNSWSINYALLKKYRDANGDCLVPSRYKVDGVALGQWVGGQRKYKDKLPDERIKLLDDIGFVWRVVDEDAWDKNYKLLKSYSVENGDCLVSSRYKVDGVALGLWVGRQRSRKDKLPDERIKLLDDIGFVWEVGEEAWDKNYKLLKSYSVENGDCLVPSRYKVDGVALGGWVSKQRNRKDKLPDERIKLLDVIGFVWRVVDEDAWDKNYKLLKSYSVENGDCLVSSRYKVDGVALGKWVGCQRSKKDKLPDERIKLLDDIGFVWKVR
ncbi:Helicase associated domain protein [Vibrio vulnificus]|nr:Helicase associated domain protein [Vibrio vulnificus]